MICALQFPVEDAMRSSVWIAVCVAACVAVAACGKPPEGKRAEDVKKGAEQVQKSADQMAKGLADMAKGIQGLSGGGDSNQKPVDPVSFHDLQTAFGDLSG